ncbi:nuclear transport factor 2 family protein [Nocardia sp. NPDC101769]|uniref:nuclear transport factor 2 family protein n=1 Tax=Nocardia sp. NPDC101769 TaxID=3364333 RepID=UPI0038276E13
MQTEECKGLGFPTMMERGDLQGALALLAPDVVLRGPVARYEFTGIDDVGPVIGAVQQSFHGLRKVEEYGDAHTLVIRWTATILGRPAEGTDFFRFNEDGLVREIVVFIRPFDAVAAAATVIGRRLARRRSRTRGAVTAALTRPLVGVIRTGDRMTPGLLGYAAGGQR